MYILYEHLRSPEGEILATQMLFSSYIGAAPKLNWRSDSEKAAAMLVKDQYFKAVPLAERMYSGAPEHIWTFLGASAKTVYDAIKTSPIASMVQFLAIDGLEEQVKAGFVADPAKNGKLPKAADFFYNTAPAASTPALTRESAAEKLAPMLGVEATALAIAEPTALKKLYRSAALMFHPDRNNGDGSKMSELNMLWQVFNG